MPEHVAPHAGARVHYVQQVTDARERTDQVLSTVRGAEPTSEGGSSTFTTARSNAARLDPSLTHHDGAGMAQSARVPGLTGDTRARQKRMVQT